jgi:adenosine deaminase
MLIQKNLAPGRSQEFYQSLPKVELHRHLEGSLRLETMVEIARQHGMRVQDADQLRSLVQVNDGEPYNFKNFLSKFETLRTFHRSPEIIGRFAQEVVADAAADNVRYLELRFTPMALSAAQGFPLTEVIDWVIENVDISSRQNKIKTRLIVSLNRHESVSVGEKIAALAVDRKDRGIVALDLAGNEAQFPALPFAGVMREARQAGLHITIHAGEWGGASNVADAIRSLYAERIGHGVRVMEDPEVVELSRAKEIPFCVCMTSNIQSGIAASLEEHPIRSMMANGLNITLNTDDPSISQIRLSDEYRKFCEGLGFHLSVLRQRLLSAAQAAFLPAGERQALVQQLSREFTM